MIDSLLFAFGLVLVFEGIMPFIAPSKWRRTILSLSSKSNKFLRWMGFTLMIIGAAIIIVLHNLT